MTEHSDSAPVAMSAEAGYGLDEAQTPLRVSGFIALIFGLLSPAAVVMQPFLLIPLIGIGFGFFALRRYEGPKPVGIRAAMIGLILAVGFGSCGFFVPWFKTMTLGSQAEYFARQYVEVIARGELEMAMELKKTYNNRFLHTMPLKEHYESEEALDKKNSDGTPTAFEQFKDEGTNKTIEKIGPNAEWWLARPTRVYHSFRLDRAQVFLATDNGGRDYVLYIEMIYLINPSTGIGQWNVHECIEYGEPIVAESIL